MNAARPIRSHLVLVGGGHAHAEVLRTFGIDPLPDVRVTLVAKEIQAPYSGMLPGLIAGHYAAEECHIDMIRLAAFAGADVVHGEADGVDAAAGRLSIRGRPPLGFDLLSLDVGLTPSTAAVKGAAQFGLAVKPISTFWPRWNDVLDKVLEPGGPRRFAVVGGGPAGYELVLAIRNRVLAEAKALPDGERFAFALVTQGRLLETVGERARRMAREELARAGVALVENERVEEITAAGLTLASGRRLPCGVPVLCTEGAAPPWLAASGLACDELGFALVRPTLQLVDHDNVFAAGDCASLLGRPLPKAGVFAVRQAPVLADNLRRRSRQRPLRTYRPQTKVLALLSNGRKSAIATRGRWAFRGASMWWWKDAIDRRFMRRFHDLPDIDRSPETGPGRPPE